MSRLEFIERLPAFEHGEERWLVRTTGTDELRVAWIFNDEDPEWLDEIERRTRSWVGFAHPRVSRIFALAWLDGRLVVAIDDDRGPTLAAAAAQIASPIDRERWVVAQTISIADGLTAMMRHVPKFVHRQLEPQRLFVGATGHVRLRAPVESIAIGRQRSYLGAGTITGTAKWMSPEQCLGKPLGPASDVFSLASNLYYALTGRPPWSHESEFGTLEAIVRQPPPKLATQTPALANVLDRAFAKEPSDRHRDVAQLASDLRSCVPDAADYDAVVSDVIAAWWPTAKQAHGVNHMFGDRCTKKWEELTADGSDDIRYCGGCKQHVVQVSSIAAAVPLVGQRCLALRTVD